MQNRTPYLIEVEHTDVERYGVLVIPPFGERLMASARLKPFEQQLVPLRQRHQVRVIKYREPRRQLLMVPFAVVMMLVFGVATYDLIVHGTLWQTEFAVAVTGAVVVSGIVRLIAGREASRLQTQLADPAVDADDLNPGPGGVLSDSNETSRRTMHVLVLLLVVFLGCVLPVVAIFVATDTSDFVTFDGGFRVRSGKASLFTSRVIQMLYVSILSLFPALLYFQFDRHRVGTVWRRWVRAIFRMDWRLQTLADLNARYGDELDEASFNSSKTMRFVGGNHSPIVIATALIAMGWVLLVLPTESYDFSAVSDVNQQVQLANDASERASDAAVDAKEASSDAERDAAAAVADEARQAAEEANDEAAKIAADSQSEDTLTDVDGGTPDAGDETPLTDGEDEDEEPTGSTTPEDGVTEDPIASAQESAELASGAAEAAKAAQDEVLSTSYFQLLTPQPSAAAMAFLGAYFFAVYLVLRSYFRGDLRPKSYNQITARLVTVVVVAYLINVLLFGAQNQNYLMAFAFVAGVVPRTMVRQAVTIVSQFLGRFFDGAMAAGTPLTNIDGIDLYDANLLEAVGISDVSALANSDLVSVMVTTRLPAERLVDWADQAVLLTVVGADVAPDESGLSARVGRLRQSGIRTATDFVNADQKAAAGGHAAIEACLHGSPTDPAYLTGVDVSDAIRRQPAWDRIEQWRTHPLALTREWVLLDDEPTAPVNPVLPVVTPTVVPATGG